jgi:hypothetical protein
MTTYWLSVNLLSDATFGGGTGVIGLVDVEIEHDAIGCPFLGGRALKGLLLEEFVNLRFALGHHAWDDTATALFGRVGAMDDQTQSQLSIGAAQLPAQLREALHVEIRNGKLRADEALTLLTTIRHQTSITAAGGPEEGSLRAMRALLRDTPLLATITAERPLTNREQGLLAACALGVRRGGVARNRGRGRLTLALHEHEPDTPAAFANRATTERWFAAFADEVQR